MPTIATESFVRINYTERFNRLSPAEKAARQHLETAINEAVERFHNETPGQDGLISIELYPTE